MGVSRDGLNKDTPLLYIICIAVDFHPPDLRTAFEGTACLFSDNTVTEHLVRKRKAGPRLELFIRECMDAFYASFLR